MAREGQFAAEILDLPSWLDARRSVAAIQRPDITTPHQNGSRPGVWRRYIRAAMSWVAKTLIEGFAAYGEAMHPGCFGPYTDDFVDHHKLGEPPRWDRFAQHRYHSEPSACDPWSSASKPASINPEDWT